MSDDVARAWRFYIDGGGRYLLDTIKGADLGSDGDGDALVLDFNDAYHPSCAYDPRRDCPLAPPVNRLDIAVEAGERYPWRDAPTGMASAGVT